MEEIFKHEDVVASFPYTFLILKEEDGTRVGDVTAFLYRNLKLDSEQEKNVNKELEEIPCIEGCGFYLKDKAIEYHTSRPLPEGETEREAEITTRRPFIEDYIEAADELDSIARKYDAEFLKTEFVY